MGWPENLKSFSIERLKEIKSYYQGEIEKLDIESPQYERSKARRLEIIKDVDEALTSRQSQ
jgi:hypothetical protein